MSYSTVIVNERDTYNESVHTNKYHDYFLAGTDRSELHFDAVNVKDLQFRYLLNVCFVW
jgi:hypothetical protein